MKVGQINIITARGNGLCMGDVVNIGGAIHVVTAVTRDSFSARRIGWIGQLLYWLRSSIRISGFWARVWSR